ncbi:uncharacterized protein LOC127750941 [Frankliniella occidentalis]|uniref:Uncharacterized protein LOC127750941 n=1 Tax=Frankliniella occidentalis TaxID=133901 RepID=A0A9C6X5U2_FRAOC|nr:uncharacterized protein LOC127750941 [Frankliniella occidentalis]
MAGNIVVLVDLTGDDEEVDVINVTGDTIVLNDDTLEDEVIAEYKETCDLHSITVEAYLKKSPDYNTYRDIWESLSDEEKNLSTLQTAKVSKYLMGIYNSKPERQEESDSSDEDDDHVPANAQNNVIDPSEPGSSTGDRPASKRKIEQDSNDSDRPASKKSKKTQASNDSDSESEYYTPKKKKTQKKNAGF